MPRPHAPDRGSGAVAVILFAPLIMVLAAFVIDGGLSIHMRERAANVAEQAARYAANHIDVTTLRNGGAVAIDKAACDGYVTEFANSSGLSIASASCVPGTPDDTVTVKVSITYHPAMLGLFYDGDLTVSGHATAKAVQQ